MLTPDIFFLRRSILHWFLARPFSFAQGLLLSLETEDAELLEETDDELLETLWAMTGRDVSNIDAPMRNETDFFIGKREVK